jgi:hypothetical protein
MKLHNFFHYSVGIALYMAIATIIPIGETQAEEEPIGSIQQCVLVSPRYQAVWQKRRVGSPPQYLNLDLSRSEFNNRFNYLRTLGFRIHRIATYVLPDCAGYGPSERERIDVVWVYAPAVPEQWSLRVSRDEFDRTADKMFEHGWGLHTIDAYSFDGQVLYNAVWRMIPSQRAVWGYSFSDFKKETQKMHDLGLTMRAIDSVVTASEVSYSAAWDKTPKAATFVVGYSPKDFSELYGKLRGWGWNIIALNSAGHATEWEGIDASLKLANKLEKRFTGLSALEFDRKHVDMVSQYWYLVDFSYEPSL